MKNTITQKLSQRLKTLDSNAVFIINDFIDIAEYDTIRKTLNRLDEEKKILKIMRGIYYQPRFSELLQEYEAPSPHQVALAIARKFNWTIAPSGITALNMLGISTQVSAKWTYISDGNYKTFELGKTTIEFKRRNNREIAGMSYKTALIIQGIKALGRNKVDDISIIKMREMLSDAEKQTLLEEAKTSLIWVYQVIKTICEVNSNV